MQQIATFVKPLLRAHRAGVHQHDGRGPQRDGLVEPATALPAALEPAPPPASPPLTRAWSGGSGTASQEARQDVRAALDPRLQKPGRQRGALGGIRGSADLVHQERYAHGPRE